MRVSPGPSTRTWPPVNAAISEFVVPKSMPTISSLIFFLPCRRARNFHLRRPKHFSIPFVTAAVNLDHRAFGNGARFLRDRRRSSAADRTPAPDTEFRAH